MILLITKYNLSSRWLHLLTFIIFYLICIKLHYIELNINNNFVECMMRKPVPELPTLRHKNLFPEELRSHVCLQDQASASYHITDLITKINKNVDQYQNFKNDNSSQVFAHITGDIKASLRENIKKNLNLLEHYKIAQSIQNADTLLQTEPKNSIVIENIQEAIETDMRTLTDRLTNQENKFNIIEQVLIDKASNSALSRIQAEVNTNISTLQTELANEINTRKVLETRVTNLEEELREIRRALMFRGTIMDPFLQQQLTLNEVKQTTQETNIAVLPR